MELRGQRRWINVAAAASLLALGAGVATAVALSHTRGDLGAVISSQGVGRPVFVGLGAVVNNASVGGPALAVTARDSIAGALASRAGVTTTPAPSAQRGARARAPQGHVFDANIQSVRVSAESVQVSVSIVVSTSPGREYEFESTSSVTLSGPSAATPEGQTDCARRAMTRAAQRAVDQIVR